MRGLKEPWTYAEKAHACIRRLRPMRLQFSLSALMSFLMPCCFSVLATAVEVWKPLPSVERWIALGILRLSEFRATALTALAQSHQCL